MKKGWRMCLSLCTLCGLTAKFPVLNRYCGFKQRIQGWEGEEKPRDWQQEHEEEDVWTQEIVCHHGSMVAHKNVNQHQKCQLGPLQDKVPGGLGEQYPVIGVPIGSTGSNSTAGHDTHKIPSSQTYRRHGMPTSSGYYSVAKRRHLPQ